MTAPTRHHTTPDPGAVADLTATRAGRIEKAPEEDPVLAAAGKPARAARRPAPAPGSKEQLKVWVSAEDAARLRAVFLNTRTETGNRSLSDLVVRAALKEAKRLEKAHHGGKPYEPAAPGDLPTGRPIGA